MTVTLNSRSTIKLPLEVRTTLDLQPGDPFEVDVQNGAIVLTPVKVGPHRWVLSRKGEQKEAVATAEIEAGKTKVFATAQELIKDLHEPG